MSHAFIKVLEISFGASFLVLAVVLARLVLKKAPKWIRLLLWALVAVRLLLPITPESPASLVPDTVELSGRLEASLDTTILAPPANNAAATVSPAPNTGTAAVVPDSPATAQGPSLLTVLAWVWVGGMAIMALTTAFSYLRLRRKVATAVRMEDRVYQSENVASPFILGLLRPRIYLPFSMEAASLSHVLAHEYAHLKRRDHLWKPLGFLFLTVHWFNPLMWLGYILLCRDIELACDERVIKGLDAQSRADYSQVLLSSSISRRSIAACPLAFGEVGVGRRIKSVLSYKKPAFWLIVVAVAILITVAVCFLTSPISKKEAAPQALSPEDLPVAYAAILSDYKQVVDFRLSDNFEADYNNGVGPKISDTLANCISDGFVNSIEDDLEYHFHCMLIEMAKGVDDLSEESFGYILQDVNRDGSAELFWVRDDYTILAAFTIHNGQAKMIDAFWARHAMIVTEDGLLYTRSSSGADYTSFRLSKLEDNGTLSQIVEFGTEGQTYYEINGGEKVTIDQVRTEALFSKYPFEASAAWRRATIYTAIPEEAASLGPMPSSGLFLIENTPENLVSIQLPTASSITDSRQEQIRAFLLGQIQNNFGAAFTLELSTADIPNKSQDYTLCYLEAQSRIAYQSEHVISMVFEGMYNQKGAAHPIQFLWALNYNPTTGEALSFVQQYQVDGGLYRLFAEGAEAEILASCGGRWPEGWGSFSEEICSEEQFLAGLSEGGAFHYYFTENGVVVSYGVPFALGDHREVLLPYDGLTAKGADDTQMSRPQPNPTQPSATQPSPSLPSQTQPSPSLPSHAQPETTPPSALYDGSQGLEFHYYEGYEGYLVESVGSCTDSHVRVPEVYNGKPVVGIANQAFIHAEITGITLPSTLVVIGEGAFSHCKSLTAVQVPDGVTYIGRNAFMGCSSLTVVQLPDSLSWIERRTFQSCTSLEHIDIPDGVTVICEKAFYGCSALRSVTMPDSLLDLGTGAFYDCCSLASIEIPSQIGKIATETFAGCASLSGIRLPEGCTLIEASAFEGCSGLRSVHLPASLLYIQYSAFQDCTALVSIDFPEGLKDISWSAFEGCTSLTSVTLPAGMTFIHQGVFRNCTSLSSVTIPNGYTHVCDYAFAGCVSLSNVVLPETMRYLDNYAFSGCTGLRSIEMPAGIVNMVASATSGCTSLSTIAYRGTMAQWEALPFGAPCKVICSDGEFLVT